MGIEIVLHGRPQKGFPGHPLTRSSLVLTESQLTTDTLSQHRTQTMPRRRSLVCKCGHCFSPQKTSFELITMSEFAFSAAELSRACISTALEELTHKGKHLCCPVRTLSASVRLLMQV